MKHQFRILVIEDNSEIADLLNMILSREGFDVVTAENAQAGLRAVYQAHPDAILLDVTMPEMDGFEACSRIRELTDVPVLMMTGHATETQDVVHGFAVGADDYITKPFSHSELISRIYARLRGATESKDDGYTYLSPDASIMLNVNRHELIVEGRYVYLPPREFKVLQLLLSHPGQVFSVDVILAKVWGSERVGEPDLIKQYIYRLRKRIEPNPRSPRYIRSVRGGGYYFEAPGNDGGSPPV